MGFIIFTILIFLLAIKVIKLGKERVRKRTYQKELNDPRWKKKRSDILQRDGYRCTWCGSRRNLQVHHKYYNKYPDGSWAKAWDYPSSCLMTLCDKCHKNYHRKYRIKTYYRQAFIHY